MLCQIVYCFVLKYKNYVILFQCSIHECGVEEWNVKESRNFRNSWGQRGQVYPCYYDPAHPEVAILNVVGYEDMLHAVLWPTLCLMSGTLMWLGLWMGCWTIEIEHKQNYPQRTYAAGMMY